MSDTRIVKLANDDDAALFGSVRRLLADVRTTTRSKNACEMQERWATLSPASWECSSYHSIVTLLVVSAINGDAANNGNRRWRVALAKNAVDAWTLGGEMYGILRAFGSPLKVVRRATRTTLTQPGIL